MNKTTQKLNTEDQLVISFNTLLENIPKLETYIEPARNKSENGKICDLAFKGIIKKSGRLNPPIFKKRQCDIWQFIT